MQCVLDGAVVITDGDLIFYHTDFYVEDGILVIYNGENHLFTDKRYFESALKCAKACVYLQALAPYQKFLQVLKVKKIGLIYGYTTASTFTELQGLGYELFDCTESFNSVYAKKTESQLTRIKKACEITERAFLDTLPFIKEGVTELELSAELEHNFKRLGGGVGFETIVAFGKGSSVPHYKTGNVKLEKNMPILMDFGCVYNGFLSDITRTLFFGEPTLKFRKVYEVVKNAHLKAVKEIRSGITCGEADAIARDYLDKRGYGDKFYHSLGHGIGVKVHEFPTLRKNSETALEDGMVFSVEPGVYLEGEFGVRIEDTVTLENGKCVSLMTTDKDLLIIKG